MEKAMVCYRVSEYENRLKKLVEGIKKCMETKGEIVVKTTGDKFGIMYSQNEGGYVVYYYGNAYTKAVDCDLVGVWPTIEDFAKNLF